MLALSDPEDEDEEEDEEGEGAVNGPEAAARSARQLRARREFDQWLQDLVGETSELEDADQYLLGDGSLQTAAGGGEDVGGEGRWVMSDLGFGLVDEEEEEDEEEDAEGALVDEGVDGEEEEEEGDDDADGGLEERIANGEWTQEDLETLVQGAGWSPEGR